MKYTPNDSIGKIMKNLYAFIFLLFTALMTSTVKADEISIGNSYSIDSKILGEAREYWISLPISYRENGSKKYPVFYMFDAEQNSMFHTYSSMIRQMSGDASPLIPEMIVVGIVSQQRVRDSSPTRSLTQYGGTENQGLAITGGADRFLQFITKELIPVIENDFHTTDYRLIAGYSFTGLPVLQALYTMPESFNAYIAVDPSMWWDEQVMLKQYNKFVQSQALNKRELFIATVERVADIYPKENYVMDFINLAKNKPKAGLRIGSHIFGKEENHHSMRILSIYKSLRFIFDGFMVDDHARFRPADKIKQQLENVSERLGSTFHLREDLVRWFGYDRLYNNQFGIDVNRAIEFFKLNTNNYPQSADAWDSLAEGYRVAGEHKKALKANVKSLGLSIVE